LSQSGVEDAAPSVTEVFVGEEITSTADGPAATAGKV